MYWYLYSVLIFGPNIFVFVFGFYFWTEYIRIRIRFLFLSRIYSYSYSAFIFGPNIFVFVFGGQNTIRSPLLSKCTWLTNILNFLSLFSLEIIAECIKIAVFIFCRFSMPLPTWPSIFLLGATFINSSGRP